MKKKLALWTVAVLLCGVVGYVLASRGSTPEYTYRFDNVSRGDLNAYVTATGTVNAVISVDVGTQVSGIVSKLYADFNSVVKKGQLIAQIDSTFLVQSVMDAEASLDKAQAQLDDSKRNMDREKALLDRGLESQINYDASLTTYETNEADVKSAQSALDRAKINLAYATIRAPVSGVVINRAVNVGQTVAASFSSPTLYTIANDLSKMQVLATVDESDIGRISIGQKATFTVDAYPDETFNGIISQIRLEPQVVQNVVNYTVVIDVNNDRLELMPGMTANVQVLVADAHNVLRVPNMALRFRPPPELVDSASAVALKSPHAGKKHRGTEESDASGVGMYDTASSVSGDGINGSLSGTRPPKTSTAGMDFGITPRFPEYEKGAYVPLHRAGRAGVWILNGKGKLIPVFVETGISDGRYTEIHGSNLKPGEQIVMGAMSTAEASSDQFHNVLSGGGRPGMIGGRFR